MKLLYPDAMVELEQMIARATAESCQVILVSKEDMRALIKHGRARAMFPAYFEKRDSRLVDLEMRLKESRRKADGGVNAEDMQAEWDLQSRLEVQMHAIREEVPSHEILTYSNHTVRVSLSV